MLINALSQKIYLVFGKMWQNFIFSVFTCQHSYSKKDRLTLSFQVSTTGRVSLSPSTCWRAQCRPSGSWWPSRMYRSDNLIVILTSWLTLNCTYFGLPSPIFIWGKTLFFTFIIATFSLMFSQVIVVLSNLDNQDYSAFWPLSTSTPIMWDAGYSQVTVSVISQDDFLPR